jgi:single-strand DNA-binding protein
MQNNNRLPTLNKVLIIGNLTKDPELRHTQAGVSVVNFKIASSKKYKDSLGTPREDVCHIGVVAWQKLAESCKDYLLKGSTVLIEGELRSRIKETADGAKRNFIEIKAFHIQFLDRKGEMSHMSTDEQMEFSSLENDHLPNIDEFTAKLEAREENDSTR